MGAPMSGYPTEFFGLITRTLMARMLTETYAVARNLTLDESYHRLETSLSNLRLIQGLQDAIWKGMHQLRPDTSSNKLIERAAKRATNRKRFKAIRISGRDEGPWAALIILIEMNAGFSTGEAMGMLDTPQGAELVERGFEVIGRALAKTLVG
jgi:hypothetical protein